MGRAPKPTRLQFGVRTAKRRAQPNEFNVTLKMEHQQCIAWYEYIHSELVKISKVLESQAYPPGFVIGAEQSHKLDAPREVEVIQPTTTTEEV
jgi:hypothetical protein